MAEPRPFTTSDNLPHRSPSQRKPLGLLAWIAGYKLAKAAIAICGGIVVYRLGGRDLVSIGHRFLIHVGLDPEGKMGVSVLHRLSQFDPRRLYWTMAIFFAYAVLYCVEAVGLAMEKRWAEWLTVVQTGILVPIEVNELIRRPGPIKAAAFCLSVGTIFYLVWRIREDSPEEAGEIPRH